jgi:hypothetical protein
MMTAFKFYQQRKIHCWMRLICGALGAFLLLSIPMRATPSDESAAVLNQVPMELKPYAIAPGQRLQKRGKERLSVSGTITCFGEDLRQTEPVKVTWQYPMKIRLDQGGNSLISDRNNPALTTLRTPKIRDIIQMLLEDSVEGFFALQKDRISRRYLGSGFKLEGAKESDPGMDIVLMTFPDNLRDKKPILKSYWFDSSTKLLGVVAYTSFSGTTTHIVIDDWRDVAGEQLPFRIERWEDNKLMMRLILDSAAFMAGGNDGTFGEN